MERREAAALQLYTYDTGRPCKHGHPSIRYTVSGVCVGCNRMNARNSKEKFLKQIRQQLRPWKTIHIDVHPESYNMLMEFILANNRLMGVPDQDVIDAPPKQEPFIWVKNPFAPAPAFLPLQHIAAYCPPGTQMPDLDKLERMKK